MKHELALAGLVVALILPVTLRAAETPSWPTINSDIQKNLLDGKWNICDIAKELAAKDPKNATEAMTKLSVMLRAGMDKEAIKTIKQLKKFVAEMTENSLSNLCYDCTQINSDHNVALAIVETFPDVTYKTGNMWSIHFTKAGWSPERIDKWMSEMEKQAEHRQFKSSIPEEYGSLRFRNIGYWEETCSWRIERTAYLVSIKKGENYANQMKSDVEKKPSDTRTMLCYMELFWRLPSSSPQKRDIGKLVDTYKPGTALEANLIADKLLGAGCYREALKLNMRALEMPLTPKEKEFFSTYFSRLVLNRHVNDEMIIHIMQEIAECNLRLGNMAEAEKFARKVDDLRRKNGVPENFFLDGTLHKTAYGKEVGEKLLQQEKSGQGLDVEFWKNYLSYFSGSGNVERQDLAFRKILELLKPQPPTSENGWGVRGGMIINYADFLKRQHKEKEAYALLINEMKTAGPDSESGLVASVWVAYEMQPAITTNEKVIWDWLSMKKKWGENEKQMLAKMFSELQTDTQRSFSGKYEGDNTMPGAILQAAYDRAIKLTEGKDFSRSLAAGEIMTMGYPRIGRPLLHNVLDNSNDSSERAAAAFRLYLSYLASKKLQNAEMVYPLTSICLDSRDTLTVFNKMVTLAAELGERQAAMRLWRKSANCNLRQTKLINQMINAGMTDDLVKYYDEIAKKLPDSVAPAEAMKILHKKQ